MMPPIIMMMYGLIILIIAILVIYYVWSYRAQIKDIHRVRKHARAGDRLLIDYYRIDDVFILSHQTNQVKEVYTWVSHDT